MNWRAAGQALGVGSLGAAAGAGGVLLGQYVLDQMTLPYERRMTQEDHAKNNIGGTRERLTGIGPEDLAMYEGIRQGLMAGEIAPEEVNQMAADGKLSQKVMAMLTDVHDWGRVGPDPAPGQTIDEFAPVEALYAPGDPNSPFAQVM